MKKWIYNIALATITAILTTACVGDNLPTHAESTIIREGMTAPNFWVDTLDGSEFTLSECRCEVVLLIFFSHQCPDCKALFDDIEAQIEPQKADFNIIAINRDGDLNDTAIYREERGYTLNMAADPDKQIYSLYATTYVPRCYVIDREGVVRLLTIEYDKGYVPSIIDCIAKL